MTTESDRALNLNIERPCLPTLCTPLSSGSQPWSAKNVEAEHEARRSKVRVRTPRCPKSGAKGIRTPDLLDANESRYQLRHSPWSLAGYQPTGATRKRRSYWPAALGRWYSIGPGA